jgi:hypothetical protein
VFAQPARAAEPVARAATANAGAIDGTVTDDAGVPLGGVTVSAFGAMMAFAVTDNVGRFTLEALPPGPYIVRAHCEGFAASKREVVEVGSSAQARFSVVLQRLAGPASSVGTSGQLQDRPVMAAGFAGAAGTQVDDSPVEEAGADNSNGPHEHTETAWRIRHAKRSVLKDATAGVSLPDSEQPSRSGFDPGSVIDWGSAAASQFAASLFNDLPFTGEFNLLTMSSFDRPQELFSRSEMPRGVAFLSIGAPAGRNGDWSVQGAMTEGDVSSWVLAGSYANRALDAAHQYEIGMSYSMQRYEGGNAAALAAVTDGSRNVGAVSGADDWTINDHVLLSYGARYAWHDYLDNGNGMVSPRAAVTLSPTSHTRVRVLASQRRLAPGAEEFLPPPMPGMWLPPERTFAPLVPGGALRAERARHLEFAIERDLGERYVVTVRRFYQRVDDQLVTLFGVRLLDGPRSDLGHYYVGNAGQVEADGWGVSFSHAVTPRLRGTVDYSQSHARWALSAESALLSEWAPSTVRDEFEDVHDLTTTIETDIPETATRLYLLYKLNNAFTRANVDSTAAGPGARFDLQVHQALPFLPFTNTNWELLVAVRNLFREPVADGSFYDELLVVRPPKRIVGGLLVRF